MKPYLKLALIGLAAVPFMAHADQYALDITTVLPHYDIDGIGGGGPFTGSLIDVTTSTTVSPVMLYCDSVSQEFSPPQQFNVDVVPLDQSGNTSLDPWAIANANSLANTFDLANSVTLQTPEIESAIQGVIWNLDNQIASGPTMTSGDALTAAFANYLYTQTVNNGTTNVPGYYFFNAGPNYQNASGVLGQSQIGYPTPEPSALLGLAIPAIGFGLRRRKAKKA